MANHTYMTTISRSPLMRTKESPIRCSACGELECLCRPRYFAGQLLTEDDLNRLDRYIVEKNKLHNRYLHGWGVVCGLEVFCHPCPGEVTVKAGYALSPCGEDIIVCHDDRVNVCDLIKKCKDKEKRDYECEPFGTHSTDDACKEATEAWYLAICYDEKPSRGITALRASTEAPCCSRCSCGGSSTCGCNCHEQPSDVRKTAYRTSLKRTPIQCEPTILCEGYKYIAFKVPPRGREVRDQGALVTRFMECFSALLACVANLPPVGSSKNTVLRWCCSVRDCLEEFIKTSSVHDCQLAQKIAGSCPNPDNFDTGDAYLQAILKNLSPIGYELIQSCFCSALLPPCPEPADNRCVILATITIRNKDCQILRICNWEGRKFAVTMPNLAYWLSWLPFGKLLREGITRLCCPSVEDSPGHHQ